MATSKYFVFIGMEFNGQSRHFSLLFRLVFFTWKKKYLLSFWPKRFDKEVRGIVSGAFGEVREATQALILHLATSWVRKAGVKRGGQGLRRSEDAEWALAMSSLQCQVAVATVRCQAITLLETQGPGTTAAVQWGGDSRLKRWRREEAADTLARPQSWSAYRTGFARNFKFYQENFII